MSLSYALLGILSYGPMTGYSLKKVFDKSVAHVWAASLSQIYRNLSILEEKKYVSSMIEKQEEKPDKKIYSITEEGKNAFQGWLEDFPERLSSPNRDEFLLRIFFGSKLDEDQIIMEFKRFIIQMKGYLDLLVGIEKSFNMYSHEFNVDSAKKEELFWHLTIKRGQMTIKTLIKWAEECIIEVENYYGEKI